MDLSTSETSVRATQGRGYKRLDVKITVKNGFKRHWTG